MTGSIAHQFLHGISVRRPDFANSAWKLLMAGSTPKKPNILRALDASPNVVVESMLAGPSDSISCRSGAFSWFASKSGSDASAI
jgi:hypothetical protein